MAYMARSAIMPWLPILGGECQTKYCHHCWPHGLARSYLSINAVVNGDHPREAVHGLSFLLTRERTVSNARHVANLGLRPNPTKVGVSFIHIPLYFTKEMLMPVIDSAFNFVY
jgi:hypothetical protein